MLDVKNNLMKPAKSIDIVVTDLDGTLLKSDRTFSYFDCQTLRQLGEKNVIRVIATGRSLFSANKVLAEDFPIDYLIFSSGTGVLDWKTKKILFDHRFSIEETNRIMDSLLPLNYDFMLHKPVPDNHYFFFHQTNDPHPDFERRMHIYQGYCEPISSVHQTNVASQFVVIVDHDKSIYDDLCETFGCFASVIRATSPLDHRTMWVEIFPKNVSKGSAFRWLCEFMRIDSSKSLGVGNDYNDWDLLNSTSHSFVVNNAPEDMKRIFQITADHNSSGFTQAVKMIF